MLSEGEKDLCDPAGTEHPERLRAAEAVEAGYAAFSEEYTVYVFDRRLDLEMPGGPGATGEEILEAVKEGSLKEEDLDKAVLNLLSFVERSLAEKKEGAGIDRKACSALEEAGSLVCLLGRGQLVMFRPRFVLEWI